MLMKSVYYGMLVRQFIDIDQLKINQNYMATTDH